MKVTGVSLVERWKKMGKDTAESEQENGVGSSSRPRVYYTAVKCARQMFFIQISIISQEEL